MVGHRTRRHVLALGRIGHIGVPEICAATGAAPRTVRAYLHQAGIPVPRHCPGARDRARDAQIEWDAVRLGIPAAHTAVRLGIPARTMRTHRARLGLPVSEYADRVAERRDEVSRLARLGHSTRQIAEHLGVYPRMIERDRRALGISERWTGERQLVGEDRERAVAMLEDGASYAEVGRTLGFTGPTIAHHLPGYAWDRRRAAAFASMTRWLDAIPAGPAALGTTTAVPEKTWAREVLTLPCDTVM